MPFDLSLCTATASVPHGSCSALSAWIPERGWHGAESPNSPHWPLSREEINHFLVSHCILGAIAVWASSSGLTHWPWTSPNLPRWRHMPFIQAWTLILSPPPRWSCAASVISAHLLDHLGKSVPQPPSWGSIKYSFSLASFPPRVYLHPSPVHTGLQLSTQCQNQLLDWGLREGLTISTGIFPMARRLPGYLGCKYHIDFCWMNGWVNEWRVLQVFLFTIFRGIGLNTPAASYFLFNPLYSLKQASSSLF